MRRPSAKNREFEETIRRQLTSGALEAGAPLPPTRELAEEHGLSSSTVYRILLRLTAEKLLAQHSNGRFLPASNAPSSGPSQPFACLLPTVRMWSTALQGIMDGVTRRSSHYKRGTLLVHSEKLLVQEGIDTPPTYADPEVQYGILEDFYHRHSDHCEGVILDNIWEDEVVERLRDRLKRVVIVNRTTRLDFASSVHADFRLCAALAISHLLARGYEELFFVSSYEDCYVRQLRESVVETSHQIGSPIRKENFIYAPNAGAQKQLIERIRGSRKRIGIYTPEDNWARLLLVDLASQKVACPDKVGILSGTGTRAAEEAGMSSLKIDFERIGSLAVDLLRRDEATSQAVTVDLIARKTT